MSIVKFSAPQKKVLKSRKPLTLFMAGQRSGKSHLMGFKSGIFVSNAPKIRGMIAANTYQQLTQSTMRAVKKVWKDNFGFTEYHPRGNPNGHYVVNQKPPLYFQAFEKFDNYHGIISFVNGAVIFCASLKNYMAHDGKEIGWAELDETKDTKEEALKAVILARLSQPGLLYHKETLNIDYIEDVENPEDYIEYNPCCINTSPAVGVVKWLTDMFKLPEHDVEILKKVTDPEDFFYLETDTQSICISSTYHNAHNLPKNYIDTRLAELSEGEGLKYIFGYPFGRSGEAFYRNFEKLKHVQPVQYNRYLPIHLTFDFNSKPYMTLLAAQVVSDDKKKTLSIQVFKEYCLASPYNSTEAVCDHFKEDYVVFNPTVFYYGDASGDYRQAGSGDHTQFDTVRTELRPFLVSSSDKVPKANKRVLNRRDFLDKILEDKLIIDYRGERYTVQLVFDPSCEKLIEDFQWLKEDIDGKLKEKVKDTETKVTYEKLGHTSDALEYLVVELLEDYYDK